MRVIGLIAPRVERTVFPYSDNPPGTFCDKCQKYYNPASPHICFPGDTDLMSERRKLIKFIGDDWTLIGKEEHAS